MIFEKKNQKHTNKIQDYHNRKEVPSESKAKNVFQYEEGTVKVRIQQVKKKLNSVVNYCQF